MLHRNVMDPWPWKELSCPMQAPPRHRSRRRDFMAGGAEIRKNIPRWRIPIYRAACVRGVRIVTLRRKKGRRSGKDTIVSLFSRGLKNRWNILGRAEMCNIEERLSRGFSNRG